MSPTFLGGVVIPALMGASVVVMFFRRSARARSKRSKEISPGRVVIASNLVSSRWQ